MSKFTSITGVQVNNPEVCIGGLNTTFACVCPVCTEDNNAKVLVALDELRSKLKALN